MSAKRPMTRKKKRLTSSQLASGALAVGAAVVTAHTADAATFNVTSLNDSGDGTLRQAILEANVAAGADVITFEAGLTGTITLTTGALYVSDSVDIQGPGPAVLTVSGNNASNVFYLYSNTAVLDVTISGLTITEGAASAGGGIYDLGENLTLDNVVVTQNAALYYGGGVAVLGDCACVTGTAVTITGSTISDNTASSAPYGSYAGLAVSGAGQVTIDNTTISGNNAENAGGGVGLFYMTGPITLDTVVISGNTALYGPGGGMLVFLAGGGMTIESSAIRDNDGAGEGAGLSVFYAAGNFRIANTTISGNDTTVGEVNRGAGLNFFAGYADLVIENSTISGNTLADGEGGGAFIYAANAEIRHSTISGNTAAADGGGIFAYSGVVTLTNSVVANNVATPQGDVCGIGSFDVSFSLIEDDSTGTINDLTPAANIFNQDPQLGPLQDNGGLTETHEPAGTSPVIGAGDPAFAPPPANDQRGFAREIPDGALDMGSVELNAGTVQFAVSTDSVAENGGSITVTVTRTGGQDGAASVQVSVAGGTATGGTDYTFAGTTLNWADNDSGSKTFNITVTDDLVFEGNETVNLELSAPVGVTLGTPAAEVVTITDNETQPTISINNVTLNEGNAGPTTFPFLVTLSGQSASTITVNFTTNPIPPTTEGTDYLDSTGTVTFPPLDTSEPVDVTVNGDPDVETDETFEVVLSNPSGATILDGTGTGTIQNDDVVVNTDVDVDKALTAPGPFSIGDNISFTITVTNAGPAAATGVSVSDTIPANTAFVSATPSQGTCSGTTTVTCNLGILNNGANATITLVVQATGAGGGANTAVVTAANDSTPGNNSATTLPFFVNADAIPSLSQTMQLLLAGLMALLALGVIGKKS